MPRNQQSLSARACASQSPGTGAVESLTMASSHVWPDSAGESRLSVGTSCGQVATAGISLVWYRLSLTRAALARALIDLCLPQPSPVTTVWWEGSTAHILANGVGQGSVAEQSQTAPLPGQPLHTKSLGPWMHAIEIDGK